MADELHVYQAELEIQNEELRTAQAELERSRDHLSLLFQRSPVGYILLDASAVVVDANQTLCEMLHRERWELVHLPVTEFIEPEDAPLFLSRYKAFFKRPDGKSIETRLLQRGGGFFHARLEARFLEFGTDPRDAPEGCLLVVATDITQRKQAEEHRSHIQQVLRTIRKINQLITTETDPQRLIERACARLTEGLGYHNAWIALFEEEDRSVSRTASSGFSGGFARMQERLEKGLYSKCMRQALERPGLTVIEDPPTACPDCPLMGEYVHCAGFAHRLEFGERVYGILSVSVPAAYAHDSEEQDLFNELADDLAFGLRSIRETEALRMAHDIIVRSPAVAFVWKNQEGWPVEFASENTEGIFGWGAGDFLSGAVSYPGVIHPEDLERVSKEVARDSADPTAKTVDHAPYRIVRRDGETRWVEDRTVIRRKDGTVTAFEGILIDVTSRVQAEEELKRSREQFMLAVKGSKDGIWDWDLRDDGLFLSERWKEMLGYRSEEVPNVFSSFEGNLHPGDRARVLDHVNRYLKGECADYEIEFRMRHKDGSYRWILARGEAVRDEHGNPIRMAGSHTDITEQKMAAERLAETKQEFEYIFENSYVGIMFLRGGRYLARGNQRLADILGYGSPEEMVGMSMRRLHLSEERFEAFGEQYYAKLVHGEQFNVEYKLRRRDGTPVWCTLSGKALDATDLDRGVIWVIDDLEPRKRAERALLETNRQLEEAIARANRMATEAELANQAKSEFLANMSHEIRTPMNGVIGMTGLLMDTELTEEQRHYASTVRSSAESLLALINDILDFSKIEAGKIEMEELDFDLRVLLEDFSEMMAFKAHEKGLEFVCAATPETPSRLRGDPGRLRQILVNLAGNAIKFTEQGEIAVRAAVESETRDRAVIRFSVRDTGVGIPEDKQGILFDKFSQADASTTRRFGGTGLGLAISKELAGMMHGDIGVASEEGAGSTFWFTARFSKQPAQERPALTPAGMRGARILVVDDNATNREIVVTQLEAWGARPTHAPEGETGLRRLREALEAGDPFEVAVLDMQMPGMDGEALGRIIKADEGLQDTLLVMMTSVGQRGDAARFKKIGFDAYLSKPVRQSELFDSLAAVLSGGSRRAGATHIVTRHSAREWRRTNVRILVAEDNITNQQVALGILEKFGLRAEGVANGAEAVRALETIPYDLVLMDVQMPEMDGLEATRIIRDPASRVLDHGIPVIAMTAHAMEGDREKCLEAGMNHYIAKPVRPQVLEEALGQWIPVPDKRNDPGHGGKDSQTARSAGKGDSCEPEDVFDRRELLARLMEDDELTTTVIRSFLDDMPGQIRLLGEHLENGSMSGAVAQAHKIKGAAGNIMGRSLQEVAAAMEQAGRAGDLGEMKNLMPGLEDRFLRLKEAMES